MFIPIEPSDTKNRVSRYVIADMFVSPESGRVALLSMTIVCQAFVGGIE